MTRRHQAGHIGNRTAADKQTANRRWQSTDSAKPLNHSELERGRSRAAEPRTIENLESSGERVRHCADKIVRPGNKREKARMVDVQVVWENIALELCQ